jgi:hypothetical protein
MVLRPTQVRADSVGTEFLEQLRPSFFEFGRVWSKT